MDEIFHVRQAQAYCDGKFYDWDPKITTPPGLYLVAYTIARILALVFGQKLSSSSIFCSLQALRWYNTLLSAVCMVVTLALLRRLHGVDKPSKPNSRSPSDVVVHALCLSFFPPYFFCCSLFYTDVGSTAAVLLMILLCRRGFVVGCSIAGAVAILFRQTNAVWVCFAALDRVVSHFEKGTLLRRADLPAHVYQPVRLKHIPFTTYHFAIAVFTNIPSLLLELWSLVALVVAFILAVYFNGGVALGDRDNHVLALHLPQVCYFLGSTLMLQVSWGLTLRHALSILTRSLREAAWCGVGFAVAGSLAAVAVWKFTIVHPFLLADNRHYTFYIWRKLLNGLGGRGKYVAIPLYVVGLWAMQEQLSSSRAGMSRLRQLLLAGAITVVLVPSPLMEFRYYVTPFFVVYSYCIPGCAHGGGVAQLAQSLMINILVLGVFLFKPYQWPDGSSARFMW
eukprot:CAMPEP_0170181412 /NCGR_PEP_ID=MMETSP0040_2-20121228/25088_1 /TAXON_ID=641309 /ORGANISM="Lotharella oceanica, Strain CCMP622" /LENGTH=450 /DNA_ID=CAMNT_0010426455 /DNA_START=12 /DNA_END=1364 /DNA_ORIENTATION=-